METMLCLIDIYSKKKIDGVRGWDLLEVGSISWSKWKNNKREMPLKYFKKICSELNIPITDNPKIISNVLVEKIHA